jgi:PhnB protein
MTIRGVTPYLIVDGGAEAIAWYRDVFGAEEVARITGGAGRIAHAELRIGGSSIFLGDEHPHLEGILSPAGIGGTPVYLDLETDDVAGCFDRAVAAGAEAIRAPTDPVLPVQSAKVRDPFGHVWLITRSGGSEAP